MKILIAKYEEIWAKLWHITQQPTKRNVQVEFSSVHSATLFSVPMKLHVSEKSFHFHGETGKSESLRWRQIQQQIYESRNNF